MDYILNWRPIQLWLVVDDFGVKYVGEDHAQHLVNILRKHYDISEDWEGTKYIGLTLDWDYERREVHVSMPGYNSKAHKKMAMQCPRRNKIFPTM